MSFGRTLLEDGDTGSLVAIMGAVGFVLAFVGALVCCTRTIKAGEEHRHAAERADPMGAYLATDLTERVFQEIYLGQLQLSQGRVGEAQYQRQQHQVVAQSPNLHLTPQPQEEDVEQQQHPNPKPPMQQNEQNQEDQQEEEEEEGGPEIPQHCWLNVEDMIIEKQGSWK